jgi:urea carboxylase
MKMEFMVEAPVNGVIRQIFCLEGGYVAAGQMLMMIHEE